MKITLDIPVRIESLNKVGPYSHWRVYAAYKRKWSDALGFLLPLIGVPEQKRRNVKITSLRKRLLDSDNLVGGCKPLVDTLKKRGYVVDDTPQWINVKYFQKIAATESTIISIT